MTFKEKLTQEHPECINDMYSGGAKSCPHTYGYAPNLVPGDGCPAETCTECWNREMPENKAEVKLDINSDGTKIAFGRIADSGERREFASGAVRDIQEGKGRFDLVPLEVIASLRDNDAVLSDIATFRHNNTIGSLYAALSNFAHIRYEGYETMFLEVAKHFEEGAKKYGENNWQKGLPVNCYIDSAVRHYLKWLRGDQDEPHDRAFVWNLMCCIWELEFSPRAEEAKKPREVTYVANVEITDTFVPSEEIHMDSPEYRSEVAARIKDLLHVDHVEVNWTKVYSHG